MRIEHFLLRLSLLLLCSFASHAFALSPDPSIHWQVLETDHFRIIYDSRHYQLAARYAESAEQAYVASSAIFTDRPAKTVVVIDDSTDLANGFAIGLPYPLITAYPVLPPPIESIADYGNWEQELMMHEFTHIQQFEPANGVARPLRWVFGTILRPNMLLPRWYLEGQAVYVETRLSNRGRLRSKNMGAIPRALVEAGELRNEKIDRLNETFIPDGVAGLRPYLLGAFLWNEITEIGGDKILNDLNVDYSRRFPFFINGPVKNRTGFDYAELLDKAYSRIETRSNEQIAAIDANGKFPAQLLKDQVGFGNHAPAISPDGQALIFISHTHNSDARLEFIKRPSAEASFSEGKRKLLATGVYINRASWLPDSSGLVFDKIDSLDHYYEYTDLFRLDINKKKVYRVTRNLRAREPAVSPDGKRIAFVQVLPGATRIAQVDLSGQNFKVLYDPAQPTNKSVGRPAVRVSQPEFLSNNEVIFAEKADDGADSFIVVNLTTNASREVLHEYRPVAFPRMTAEGLLFASGKSGVDNLYLANKFLDSARPVTNVTTRAMTGAIDKKTGELYFSRLVSDGPRIHYAAKTAWNDPKLEAPTVPPMIDKAWPEYTPPAGLKTTSEPKEYSAWPYMLPRYWFPFVYYLPEGAYFSASTTGSDPLNKHVYGVQASVDTLSKKPSVAASYTNEQTRVSYTVYGADINEYIYSGGFVRHSTMGSLTGSFYLSRASSKWKGALGVEYLTTMLEPDRETRAGPRVALSYTDVSQRGLEISPEKGGTATLAQTQYMPALGNTSYEKTEFFSTYYFSKWLPERHVISLFVNATYAPRLDNVLLGQSTSAADYNSPLVANEFVMRGYPTGAFIGRTLINENLEYRFPISYRYRGIGTTPVFLNRIHGALFGDFISVDGFSYNRSTDRYNRARLNHMFIGYGAEVRFDLNAFYYLPIRLILGAYYGADPRAGYGGVSPFIGLTY